MVPTLVLLRKPFEFELFFSWANAGFFTLSSKTRSTVPTSNERFLWVVLWNTFQYSEFWLLNFIILCPFRRFRRHNWLKMYRNKKIITFILNRLEFRRSFLKDLMLTCSTIRSLLSTDGCSSSIASAFSVVISSRPFFKSVKEFFRNTDFAF